MQYLTHIEIYSLNPTRSVCPVKVLWIIARTCYTAKLDFLHSRNGVYCQLSASHTYHNMHRSFAVATTCLPVDRAGSLVGVMVTPQSNINRKFLQPQ